VIEICLTVPKIVYYKYKLFQLFTLGYLNGNQIRGQMTIADIRQALFEQLPELETKYALKQGVL
jgi:hypothetical protein